MELTVGDAMTRGVICIDVAESVQLAAELMKQHDISSLLVTQQGDGVGLVTERDILCGVIADRKDPKNTLVSTIMSTPLITISPAADIDDAARLLRDKDIRRIVVIDEGKIIGFISEFDIVRVEPALHLLIREKSRWEITDIDTTQGGRITGICESCDNYSDTLHSLDGRLVCEDCRE